MLNEPSCLTTSVPDTRPLETHATLHGDVQAFAALSPFWVAQGRALRLARRAAGLHLGGGALALGVTVVELCECEIGARSFDLAQAQQLLKTA